MFEKEAEEYLKKDGTKAEQIFNMLNEISPLKITSTQATFIIAMIKQVYQDGAEFGYNKANEWHNVTAGDLPKGEKYGRDGVHRDIYLKDRYGKLYTGNYFPKDENHYERKG